MMKPSRVVLERLVRVRPAKWEESCDQCRHQEGRHYCLFHATVLKNMDTIRCDEWQERRGMNQVPVRRVCIECAWLGRYDESRKARSS